MRLGRFVKTPNEVKRYTIEYADWLDTGEFCASIVLTKLSGAGALVLSANAIPASSTAVDFFVSGGTDGEDYEVAARMTTTANQVKEDSILFVVRAL